MYWKIQKNKPSNRMIRQNKELEPFLQIIYMWNKDQAEL